MDTIVHPVWPTGTPFDVAIESPTLLHVDDGDCFAAEETYQIEAALDETIRKRKVSGGGWSVSVVASIFCHGLAVAAIAFLCAQSASTNRWRVARGDPNAEDAASTTGRFQNDDPVPRAGLIAPPSQSTPHIDNQISAVDPSPDDSTALPERQQPLPLTQADPLMGIGESSASQPSPHFASSKLRSPQAISKSPTTQTAAGETAPPRIAGRRGERDGLDSRGLPIPEYPYESQRRGEEGVVMIDVEVLPSGRVGDVRVTSDAGFPRLGKAAAEKVKSASFEPALADGKPVVGHLLIPYLFTLQ